MIRFECDYGEGAHSQVMQMLADTNMEQTPGYGEDAYCEKAKEYIRENEKNFTQISDELGFSSIHYFSRLFTKCYGISPIKFRQTNSKQ